MNEQNNERMTFQQLNSSLSRTSRNLARSIESFEEVCKRIPEYKRQQLINILPFLNVSDTIIRNSGTSLSRIDWLSFRLFGNRNNTAVVEIELSPSDPQYRANFKYQGQGLLNEEYKAMRRIFKNGLDDDEDTNMNCNRMIMERALEYLELEEDFTNDNEVSTKRYVLSEDGGRATPHGAQLLQEAIDLVKKKVGVLSEIVDVVAKRTFDFHEQKPYRTNFWGMKVMITILNRYMRAPVDCNKIFSKSNNEEANVITTDFIWNWAYNSSKDLDLKQQCLEELQLLFRKFGRKNKDYMQPKMVFSHTPLTVDKSITSANGRPIISDREILWIKVSETKEMTAIVLTSKTRFKKYNNNKYNCIGEFASEYLRNCELCDDEGYVISAVVVHETGGLEFQGRLISINCHQKYLTDTTSQIRLERTRYEEIRIRGNQCAFCNCTEAEHNCRVNGRSTIDHKFEYDFVVDKKIEYNTGFWERKGTIKKWVSDACSRANHYDRWQIMTKNNTHQFLCRMMEDASEDDVREIKEDRKFISTLNGVMCLGTIKNGVVVSPQFHPYRCSRDTDADCNCIKCKFPKFYQDVATSNYLNIYFDEMRLSKYLIHGFRKTEHDRKIFNMHLPPFSNMVPLRRNRSDNTKARCTCCNREYKNGDEIDVCPETGEYCSVWILKHNAYQNVNTFWLDQIFKDQDITDMETLNFMKIFAIGKMLFENVKYENWQVALFLKGEAGSGKSILSDIIKNIYGNKVGVLSDKMQDNFPLGSLVQDGDEKLAVIAPECKDRFAWALGDAYLQEMISGGAMSVARKNQTCWQGSWKIPLFMCGNYYPSFRDTAGSVARRIMPGDFKNRIKGTHKEDAKLPDKIHLYELPYIVMACAGLYLHYANYIVDDIFEAVPKYFTDLRCQIEDETNAIAEFMRPETAEVVIHPDAYMTWDSFLKYLKLWCKKKSKKQPELGKRDVYRGIFKAHNITMPTRAKKRWPPGNNEAEPGQEVQFQHDTQYLMGVGLLKHYNELEVQSQNLRRPQPDRNLCADMMYEILRFSLNDEWERYGTFESAFSQFSNTFLQNARNKMQALFLQDQQLYRQRRNGANNRGQINNRVSRTRGTYTNNAINIRERMDFLANLNGSCDPQNSLVTNNHNRFRSSQDSEILFDEDIPQQPVISRKRSASVSPGPVEKIAKTHENRGGGESNLADTWDDENYSQGEYDSQDSFIKNSSDSESESVDMEDYNNFNIL